MKGKIDKEYSTNYVTEHLYLSDNGIRYTFVKTIDGITTYKYKKTKKLFETLARFYSEVS